MEDESKELEEQIEESKEEEEAAEETNAAQTDSTDNSPTSTPTTDENASQEDPKADKGQTEPQPKPAKGKPDASRAAQKYREQRDTLRAENDSLKAKLDEQDKKIDSILEKLNAQNDKAVVKALEDEGCIDTDIVKGQVETVDDIPEFKKSHPKLFSPKQKATGIQQSGAPTETEAKTIRDGLRMDKE